MQRVFVSFAKEDQAEASRVCEMLEADGVDCWLASRDMTAEKDTAAETLDAIRDSDLVVLVFSASANASPAVLREIERAVAYQRPVLPVRIDDAAPNASLQHYLDRAPQPQTIASLDNAKESEPGSSPEDVSPGRPHRRTLWIVGAASLLVVAIGLGLGLGLGLNRHESTWTELDPSGTVPPARAAHAMTHDPITGRLILFGGSTGAAYLNDIWAYDPVADTWRELESSGTVPARRGFPSMAYDPTTRRLIVFGGSDWDTGAFLNDTWAYDPAASTWTNLNPAGALPPERAWHTMVCDSDTGRLIMFGGGVGGFTNDITAVDQLNDTWAYDPIANTWADLDPAGAVPAARYGQAMAYSPSTQRIILFGGGTATARFNDTWAYDSATNTWVELRPAGTLPSPRGGHSMAYDTTSARLIMFGGGVSQTVLVNDTWAYDPAANSWTELAPTGMLPSARGAQSMVYDPTTRQLILFGGLDGTGSFLNDFWALTP